MTNLSTSCFASRKQTRFTCCPVIATKSYDLQILCAKLKPTARLRALVNLGKNWHRQFAAGNLGLRDLKLWPNVCRLPKGRSTPWKLWHTVFRRKKSGFPTEGRREVVESALSRPHPERTLTLSSLGCQAKLKDVYTDKKSLQISKFSNAKSQIQEAHCSKG